MNLIFVYGTLKRGCSNHLSLAGQTLLGEAQTAPGHVLFDLGGYPGMVASAADPGSVSGEVWSVDDGCLERLDALEGTAEGLYSREAAPLLGAFANQGVEAYFYLKSVQGRARLGAAWTE